MNENITVGFGLTGSFCTFSKVIDEMQKLADMNYRLVPILSETTARNDTRFGKAEEHIGRIEKICGRKIISSIPEAEPIGPKKLLDILVIAPCTGNTIAKLANGIADSSITLSVKSHLRNNRPVVIAVSTNDGLGANAKNIGILLARKNIYMVPFGQDDCIEKENSLVAHFDLIQPTIEKALKSKQIQPVLV